MNEYAFEKLSWSKATLGQLWLKLAQLIRRLISGKCSLLHTSSQSFSFVLSSPYTVLHTTSPEMTGFLASFFTLFNAFSFQKCFLFQRDRTFEEILAKTRS